MRKNLLDTADATPAQVLQKLLESKWSLETEDKDMILMQHQFHYQLKVKEKNLHSSLVLEGKDQTHTAMSMTVGLPVAIATKLILQNKIQLSGSSNSCNERGVRACFGRTKILWN